MLPEFQLSHAMTEISARNCLDDEWPLLTSEITFPFLGVFAERPLLRLCVSVLLTPKCSFKLY